MREIRTLRATWRGLETWNGQIATAAGAPVLDPTCERPEVKSLRPTHHEAFNVLKTKGYNLEHNFGHGKRNLSTVLGRWCTSGTKRNMTRAPKRYAITRRQRTESGRPAASIRFRTATPMAASVCWAAKPRARRRGPISALKRPIVVSTSDRCP